MKRVLFMALALGFVFSCQKKEEVIKVECPSEEKVAQIVRNISSSQPYLRIERIEQFGDVPLCEVSMRLGVRYNVFYMDSKGRFVFPSVVDANTGEVISAKKASENQTLPKDMVKMFEERTNYEFGKGDRFVILIFEPKNQTAEEVYHKLMDWSKEKSFRLKVILMPYYANLESYHIARSVLCDKKPFEELLKGYSTAKGCEEGNKILNENMDFVLEKMLLKYNPPILLSDKGKLWVGNINKEQFEQIFFN